MNQNKDQKLDAEIGTRIADIRDYFHVSQDALAQCLKLPAAQLERYERGQAPIPATLLYRLSGAFGLPRIVFLEQLENGVGVKALLQSEFGVRCAGEVHILYSQFSQIEARDDRLKIITLATRLADS